ncbi:MAG: FkbM family methyltransferase, partial [Anaerolineaceae bacterium]
DIISQNPMTIVDVGARYGFEEHWSAFGEKLKIIGFEPDAEECTRLNQEILPNTTYYPLALGTSGKKRTFYLTKNAGSSSFYLPNMALWDRFLDWDGLEITGKIQLDTTDLDTFLKSESIGDIDFIKLDAEGSELDVLQGSTEILKSSVVGVSIEISFIETRENAPTFHMIDKFLTDLGFILYDLDTFRYSRKILPEPRWANERIGQPSQRGQIISGQALYLRDPISELSQKPKKQLKSGWSDQKLIKMACLFEIFNFRDCAMELIEWISKNRPILDLDIDKSKDLLMHKEIYETVRRKGVRLKEYSYASYIQTIKKMESQNTPEDNLK